MLQPVGLKLPLGEQLVARAEKAAIPAATIIIKIFDLLRIRLR